MAINIHHLELFYYVAKHKGISSAVRNLPYGIQQPAVSSQILQLEDSLGGTLFSRRPFSLTSAGGKLFEFIEPFFSGIGKIEEEIREGATQFIRIAASSIILRDHLPGIIVELRKKFPRLKFNLKDAHQPEIEPLLLSGKIDFGFTVLEGKPPVGISFQPLLELPMVLLVNKSEKIHSAEELWNSERLSQTLISLPKNEAMTRRFQQGLARRKVVWPVGIELNSLELMESYVNNDFGIAATLLLPNWKPSKKIRVLKLEGFQPLTIGAMWTGKLSPISQALLDESRKRTDTMSVS